MLLVCEAPGKVVRSKVLESDMQTNISVTLMSEFVWSELSTEPKEMKKISP